MANIKSQKKRNRTNEEARQRNMAVRSHMKTMVKHATTTIESGDADQAKGAVKSAVSAIDRAVSKNVVHPNAAARKKSALQQQLAGR